MKKIFLFVILTLIGITTNFGQTSQIYNTAIASTVDNPVWFFIQNPGSGRVIELSESGTNTVSLAVPLTSNNDRQLWRFVKSGTSYSIVNKGRAGTFNASFAWNNSGSETFTIAVADAYKCTLKSSSNNYLNDAAEAGSNLTANATLPTTNTGWWYFVNAPTSSTSGTPIWYQWSSLRATTHHVLASSILNWTGTVDLANNNQYWRFEATTNGYKICNRTEATNYLHRSLAVGLANNVTSSGTNATTFVISPRSNATGSLLIIEQGTTYNATDYSSTPSMGLYARSSPSENQHHTIRGFLNVPPTINTAAGTYMTNKQVNITVAATENSFIAYTIDGTDPRSSATRTLSAAASANITLQSSATVKACAYKGGFYESSVVEATYTIQPAAYGGNALNFDGTNNYMRIPHHADFNFGNTEDFSISFWVNSDLVANRNARMVSKRGPNAEATTDKSGYELWGLNAASNFYATNTTTGTSNVNLYSVWGTVTGAASTWTHIAYVVTGSGAARNIIMYQNGQVTGSSSISSKDVSTFSVTNLYDIWIGTGQYDGGYLNGKMDNIRFWDKGLSASEVESDQATTVNASTPNLIAAYDFETMDLNAMTVADTKGTHTAHLHNYEAVSISDLQQFGMSGRGNSNDPIIRATANVASTNPVGGASASITLNNAILNLTGTTNLSDISSLKVYATGATQNFDPRDPVTKGATLLGSCSPATGDITCTLSGTLAAGTHYLWITADVASNAVEGNQIDLALNSINYNTIQTLTVSPNNPTGTTNIMLARKLIVAPSDANSTHYRIPALITANDGSVIAFVDKRKNNNADLPQDIDVVAHRSNDNGQTWSAATTIAQGTGYKQGFGDVATVKTKTGKIIAIYAAGNGFAASSVGDPIKVFKSESTDNGVSWTAPAEITSQLYGTGCTNPTRAAWPALFTSSGRMLYTSTGRIMAVALVRDGSGTNKNYIMYSDDDGETWDISMSMVMSGGDEAKIMELADGSFMVTSRRGGSEGRLKAVSADGLTWTGATTNISELVEPACNGDFIRYSKANESNTGNILLHSIPNHSSSRRNVSVFVSTDEGDTWPVTKSIVPMMANNGLSAYSTLTVLNDGTIGAYVETENFTGAYELYFMNFSLDWLTDGAITFSENRWTGANSNDFATAANWSAGVVPTGVNPNLIVAGNAANPLVLTGNHDLGSITLNPGARLTIENGSTITTSGINIISDGNGMGTVLDNSGSTTRNANIKVQLTAKTGAATSDQWWYITTPVTGATSAVFRTDQTNLFGYYDEATATYPQITATTTELNKGTGYLVKLGGSNAYYELAGTLNNGDVTINLTRTTSTHPKRGFNLIGNPYSSYINWSTLHNGRTDIRPTVWYRTRTAGGQMTFDTWNGLVGTGTGKNGNVNNIIPPMQAFWVKVHEDGTVGDPVQRTVSLTLNNAIRSHRPAGNTNSTLLRAPQQNENQIIRLRVSNGSNHDEAILMTSELASNDTDRYDAEKMQNNNVEIPEIGILLNNTETAINAMRTFPLNTEIPLAFRPGKETDFSISASEITMAEGTKCVLIDKLTAIETELNDGGAYSFAADASETNDRFALALRAKGSVTANQERGLNSIRAYANSQAKIVIENLQSGNSVQIFNLAGQLIESALATSPRFETIASLKNGVYFVKVNNFVQKVSVNK